MIQTCAKHQIRFNDETVETCPLCTERRERDANRARFAKPPRPIGTRPPGRPKGERRGASGLRPEEIEIAKILIESKRLGREDRAIVCMRYGIGCKAISLDEIGSKFGKSKQTIHAKITSLFKQYAKQIQNNRLC